MRYRSIGAHLTFQGRVDRDVPLTSFEIDLPIFPDEFFRLQIPVTHYCI